MAGMETEIWNTPARTAVAVRVSRCGEAQTRGSRLIAEQAAQIEALQAAQIRLRAESVIRLSALQFEREDRLRLEAMVPGLPRRAALVRQLDRLRARIEALLRERTHWRCERERWQALRVTARPPVERSESLEAGGVGEGGAGASEGAVEVAPADSGAPAADNAVQEAELLICRTGCISHGDYWRVQDQCRRSGKPCLLIDEHKAIHAMRQGDGIVIQACPVRSL